MPKYIDQHTRNIEATIAAAKYYLKSYRAINGKVPQEAIMTTLMAKDTLKAAIDEMWTTDHDGMAE